MTSSFRSLGFPEANTKTGTVHIAVDLQDCFCKKLARPVREQLVRNVKELAADLRARGVPTLWLAAVGRTVPQSVFAYQKPLFGFPWASSLLFSSLGLTGAHISPGDYIATKWDQSGFSNPFLHDFLQDKGFGHIILSGLYTTQCVTATMLGAVNRRYACTVAYDAVADGRLTGAAQRHAEYLDYFALPDGKGPVCKTAQEIVSEIEAAPSTGRKTGGWANMRLPLSIRTFRK